MDLSDRVLGSALRAEAIRAWLEVRLEDRLEHQLQRGLHDPVRGRRDPQARGPCRAALGIVFSRTRCGTNRPALRSSRSPPSSSRSTEHDGAGCDPIDAGGSCALVAPHPAPRHDEERRVIDEVGQVIEATARIGRRPLVQLRLHHEYPQLGLDRGRATERRCSPATSSVSVDAANTLDPFAM